MKEAVNAIARRVPAPPRDPEGDEEGGRGRAPERPASVRSVPSQRRVSPEPYPGREAGFGVPFRGDPPCRPPGDRSPPPDRREQWPHWPAHWPYPPQGYPWMPMPAPGAQPAPGRKSDKRKPRITRDYEGKDEVWEDYLHHFLGVAAWNEWTERDKASGLYRP